MSQRNRSCPTSSWAARGCPAQQVLVVDEELAAVDDLVHASDPGRRPRRRPLADALDQLHEVGGRQIAHRLVEPSAQRRHVLPRAEVRPRVPDHEVGREVASQPGASIVGASGPRRRNESLIAARPAARRRSSDHPVKSPQNGHIGAHLGWPDAPAGRPDAAWHAEWLAMADEFGRDRSTAAHGLADRRQAARSLRLRRVGLAPPRQRARRVLLDGLEASTSRWIAVDGRLVGFVSIRHSSTSSSARSGDTSGTPCGCWIGARGIDGRHRARPRRAPLPRDRRALLMCDDLECRLGQVIERTGVCWRTSERQAPRLGGLADEG